MREFPESPGLARQDGTGPRMHYSVANGNGEIVVNAFPVQTVGHVMHDMAITERFAVIVDWPMFVRPERVLQRLSPYAPS